MADTKERGHKPECDATIPGRPRRCTCGRGDWNGYLVRPEFREYGEPHDLEGWAREIADE